MLRVRSRILGGWFVAAGVIGTALVGACAEQKGALMLAVNTDMKAPKDVNAVSVTISTNGAIKHSFIGRVTPQGEVLLPATLAIVEPEDVSATIRIRVMAFQDRKPRVLRDVRTTIPSGGRTALLRIPLNFVNDGSVVGSPLPANGTLPDPYPGTGGTPNGPVEGGGTSEEFDFMGSYQPPCDDIQNQTVIDGECKDNYVDPETLPDFDESALGDSTDVGSCFDLAKCFAGALAVADVGQGTGAQDAGAKDPGTSDGGSTSTPPDSGADGDSGAGVDAGAKPFKDFGLRAVTLDRSTCALQLNGANPARLNLALVTPDTGECVRPGECYVPIDRGSSGWKDENGRVQLPSYVCKLLTGKNLRLATSTEVCAAKEESNPICTPKVGDPVADSGPTPASGPVNVVPEDFATTVAAANGTLYFASQSRVGRVSLFEPAAMGVQISNIAVNGSARLPWRFSSITSGPTLALANGTAEGFVITSDGSATKVTVADGAVDVTNIQSSAGQLAWAVRTKDGQSAVYTSGYQGTANNLLLPATNISTVISGPQPESLLVGGSDGALRACTIRPEAMCFPPVNVAGRVDAFSGKVGQTNSGYVLAAGGIYRVSAVDTSQPQVAPLTLGDLSGVEQAEQHLARGLANNGQCVFFTSAAGLSYAVDNGATVTSTVLVPPTNGAALLGIAIGPEPGNPASPGAIYYAVNAPRDQGGGVWRIAIPAACAGGPGGGGGGGIGPGDASASVCGPGNCAGGCCRNGKCEPGDQKDACGRQGSQCVTCAPSDICDVPTRTCKAG